MINYFDIISLNTSRISNPLRIKEVVKIILKLKPSIVCIQEINVFNALEAFKSHFQVFVNYELESNSRVGVVTLINKKIQVLDQILSLDGRILGLKGKNFQIWNIYPKSGTANKPNRETFFRESLNNLMMNWKDSTKYLFQVGDHNCTHRLLDSLHNPEQHLQPGLISHMKIHGLKDGFCQVHGEKAIAYSRVTNRSSTRIDYILSNSNDCSYFEYYDINQGIDHYGGKDFDHKMTFGRYDIDIGTRNNFIPKKYYFRPWVIPNFLEHDSVFLEGIEAIYEEILSYHEENGENDISFLWEEAKKWSKDWAITREKQIVTEENERLNVLTIFYNAYMETDGKGDNFKSEVINIKKEINEIQQYRSKKMIDKMRGCQIDDFVYDIHKLQRERKYENQKKMNEIIIDDKLYQGAEQVLEAIQCKMYEELKPFNDVDRDAPPSQEEEHFLNLISQVEWTEEEISKLTQCVSEEEITNILLLQVDLDSSPGVDGITYRFIKKFWSFDSYRKLYLMFLNNSRREKNLGCTQNLGMMVVKNKKSQSIHYDKKRKLTKVNKDLNLGHGKVWTNRMRDIVLPKILPKTQFNCQQDLNIIDEIMEIREVNQHLLGGRKEIDGSILSIDFNNAYRSTSLRWFNLVMMKFGIPKKFIY